MKKILKSFKRGQKGFTLVELLVVVAILGVLAAVAIPNVGKFMGKGKTESYATELSNVETAVTAMMADSTSGTINAVTTATNDMHSVTATGSSGTLYLSDYMTGLNTDYTVKSGCTYTFSATGTVTQTHP